MNRSVRSAQRFARHPDQGLAAVAAGQLSVWFLGLQYDVIRDWTMGPLILAAIALISIPSGFGVFLVRRSLDGSKAD